MPALTDDLLVKVCSYITDPVTTTDELIPSGETSSYRSNPERLSEFALSRRDPQYVGRSKEMRAIERDREAGKALPEEVMKVYEALTKAGVANDPANTDIGSTIFANMPGDGSAREQAASCQRVMGASANFAKQYATKRYRSNCINWGMTPFLVEDPESSSWATTSLSRASARLFWRTRQASLLTLSSRTAPSPSSLSPPVR